MSFGYSRLVRADEDGTLDRLKALHGAVIGLRFKEHNWRIVKLMGDGILAEFGSVLDALGAAIEMQEAIAADQSGEAAARIAFRIGINLGDVVIDGDDIQADGVNVAARRAVAIDENNAWGHIALGVVEAFSGHHDEAIARLERAVEISPNDPSAYGQLGFALALSGESAAAVARLEEAMRLSPRDPFMAFWLMSRAVAAFAAGRYEETLEWSRRTIEENPRFPGAYRLRAASYGQLGQLEEARAAAEEPLRQMPGLTVTATREQVPWKRPGDSARYLDGLRKAGLPE